MQVSLGEESTDPVVLDHVHGLPNHSVHVIDFPTTFQFSIVLATRSCQQQQYQCVNVIKATDQQYSTVISVSKWRRWLSICVLLFTTLDITPGIIILES